MIFLGLIMVNIIFSLSKPLALYKTVKLLEAVGIFWVISKEKLSYKLLLVALLIGALGEVTLSMSQLIGRHSLQGIFYFFGERYFTLGTPDIAKTSLNGVEILRPYGTFSHPNSQAGFYLLMYFFVLNFSKFNRHYWLKKALLTACALLIFFSFSKIAIIVFLLLNLVYYIYKKDGSRCVLCILSRFAIFLALALIFLTAKGDPLSLEKRITLTKNALVIFQQHPLFGVGLGNYLLGQNSFPSRYPYFFLQPVHNIFLLLLVEGGVMLMGYLIYLSWKKWGIKFIKKHLLVILAVVITGLFDHYWLTLQQNLLLLPVVFGLLQQDARVVK